MMKPTLLMLLLAALCFAQGDNKEGDEKPPEEKPAGGEAAEEAAPKSVLDMEPGDIEIGDPGLPVEDASVVTSELARFQGDMKDAKKAKDDEKRAQLLLELGKKDHPKIYKAAQKYVRDKNFRVATAAVVCIARQKTSADKAGKFLQGVLDREKRTNIRCAAMVGMGVLGHTRAFDDVKKIFVKDENEQRKAAARYFGYTKAKEAFRLLAEQLDEPAPTNPNDPDNPPASYWEAKWKAWKANEKAVHWAISQLVEGETFETTTEAKKWAEAQGKEHGIEW